ncbi:centrosomal protein of 57 kDa [Betta splendens]|uniref:Centrosomal protein of 57 kDa n=1 Tax=Betta splendens TaxID=158456 RepID=A0A6P7PBE4_BETSP|nr:centrosomal protein of 57 kDa [Betta splendens]
MESLSKTSAAAATREKELSVPPPPTVSGAVSDSLSLASYKDYPVHRPFINTAQTRRHHSGRLSAPVKAFPETSSAVILSGLRSLQEKIRRLELEKDHAELSLRSLGRDVSYTPRQSDNITHRLLNNQTDTHKESRDPSNCNQVLITHLAAAESRCVKLERQLDHMRRMLHNAKADRTSLLKQQCQVSRETAKSAHQQQGTVSEHAQLEKLERLEQEYLRLTRTQNNTEIKINELELKLQEEKLQRRLIQDQAQRLQSGLEANRILLQSVSPRRSSAENKEKTSNAKKSFKQRSSHTKPHYRLSFRDVPFVAGMSAGCSHSVRANVQSVLSLLKQHQPHLCNSRVLCNNAKAHDSGGSSGHSDSESSSSTSCGEELSELLLALQDELRLMTMEQDELMRQVEDSVSDEERRELQREQERLLLKMERKGEQISKLLKHKTQMKKLKKEAISRRSSKNEVKVTNGMSTRGRSAAAVRLSPGERSRRNLRLLRDMKALQTSLGT